MIRHRATILRACTGIGLFAAAALALSACGGALGSSSKVAGAQTVPVPTVILHQVASRPAPNPVGTAAAQAIAVPTVVPIDTSAIPDFRWHVVKATKKGLGASWHPGCPVGTASLRVVTLRYWGFDSQAHDGTLVLHKDVLKHTRAVFAHLYERRFPFRSMVPVSDFTKASDDLSMAADNTSAFNCRDAVAAGPAGWSRHAYGKAIDLNPIENPYLFKGHVLPPAGAKFAQRKTARPGLIRRNDPVYQLFLAAGYQWGGRFSSPDYQHFDQ